MSLLECKDIAIGYGSDILHDHISFSVNRGNYICVLGDNGAGKTTLIKTLLGLIPVLHGTVVYDDTLKQGIGYLPQQTESQRLFPTTVEEIVLSGLQNKAGLFYSAKEKSFAREKMTELGIDDLSRKRFSDLSGGQQQRVLLARALCVSDKLLVLDEPITGLDIKSQELFYELLKDINSKGTAILMISHDANILSKNATHILEVNSDEVKLYLVNEYQEARENG